MRAVFAAAVGSSMVVCASSRAYADEPDLELGPPVVAAPAMTAPAPAPLPARAPAPAARRWYGYQTLAVDAFAVTFVFGVTKSDATAGLMGCLAYVVAAPIIHGIHHNGGAAAGSLALRLLLPLVGGLAGASAGQGDSSGYGAIGGFAVGALVGVGAASLIDGLALGYEPNARPAVAPPPRAASVSFTPVVSPRREGGVVFGLSASF